MSRTVSNGNLVIGLIKTLLHPFKLTINCYSKQSKHCHFQLKDPCLKGLLNIQTYKIFYGSSVSDCSITIQEIPAWPSVRLMAVKSTFLEDLPVPRVGAYLFHPDDEIFLLWVLL